MLNALGLIEVIGYVGAIEAADAALKAANVNLIGIEKVSAGIVTVKITGDVGAVKAGIEAAEQSANKLGALITSHVIAKVHEDVKFMLEDKDIEVIEKIVEFTEVDDAVNTPQEISCEEITESIEEKNEELVEVQNKTEEELNSMKVEELRRLARNLKIPTMTNKQIKFAKKDVLIEELIKFYKESDN